MKGSKKNFLPLASFDIHLENYQSLVNEFRRNNDISHIKSILNDSWTTELTKKVFQEDYDAIVLTDTKQKILWVSNGFRDMTGYSKKYAVGKRPSFLQGKETSKSVKSQISEELFYNHTFSGSLLNYRKNGEPYLCQISIFPIYDAKERLDNFIAFEKEISVDKPRIDRYLS
tara:strand:- start:552 stop:1067 length:516 start_codon:yes stop_codon:yes gene_type:complete